MALPVLADHVAAIRALCEQVGVTRLELCEGEGAGTGVKAAPTCFIVTIPEDGDPGFWAGRLTELETRLSDVLGVEIDLLLPGALRNDWVRDHIARRRREVYNITTPTGTPGAPS